MFLLKIYMEKIDLNTSKVFFCDISGCYQDIQLYTPQK